MTISKLRVCGSVYPATKQGFKKLLAEANQAESEGYRLVTVVRLNDSVASIFRSAVVDDAPHVSNSFFE